MLDSTCLSPVSAIFGLIPEWSKWRRFSVDNHLYGSCQRQVITQARPVPLLPCTASTFYTPMSLIFMTSFIVKPFLITSCIYLYKETLMYSLLPFMIAINTYMCVQYHVTANDWLKDKPIKTKAKWKGIAEHMFGSEVKNGICMSAEKTRWKSDEEGLLLLYMLKSLCSSSFNRDDIERKKKSMLNPA